MSKSVYGVGGGWGSGPSYAFVDIDFLRFWYLKNKQWHYPCQEVVVSPELLKPYYSTISHKGLARGKEPSLG